MDGTWSNSCDRSAVQSFTYSTGAAFMHIKSIASSKLLCPEKGCAETMALWMLKPQLGLRIFKFISILRMLEDFNNKVDSDTTTKFAEDEAIEIHDLNSTGKHYLVRILFGGEEFSNACKSETLRKCFPGHPHQQFDALVDCFQQDDDRDADLVLLSCVLEYVIGAVRDEDAVARSHTKSGAVLQWVRDATNYWI